jgi:hypothetical protein
LDNSGTRTFLSGATEYTFTSLGNATYYVAIMDFSGNKGVSSGAVVNCVNPTTTTSTTTTTTSTTTTTTEAPVTFNISGVCTGETQTITVGGFAGGNNTSYFASTVTYPDFLSAAAGAVTFVGSSASERLYPSQPNGLRYIKVTSGTQETILNGGQTNCTTTTTTAAPTTTTTTLGYAFVDIANNDVSASITNVTINGVQVDGAVFPIVAGDGASATTTQTGASRTIVVSYSGASGDSVLVTDTSPQTNCANTIGTSRTFGSQVVGDGGTIFIELAQGSCA